MSVEKRRCLLKLPLFVLCMVLFWWNGSGRVEAAPLEYCYEERDLDSSHGYTYVRKLELDNVENYSFVQVRNTTNNRIYAFLYCVDPDFTHSIDFHFQEIVKYTDGTSEVKYDFSHTYTQLEKINLKDGRVVYYLSCNNYNDHDEYTVTFNPCAIYNLTGFNGYSNEFQDVIENKVLAGVKPDEENKYIPLWNKAQDAPWFSLKNFDVTADDDYIYCTWEGVQGVDWATINSYQNTYVRVVFSAEPDGSTDDSVTKILFYSDYARIYENEFTISKDYVELPEGYEIQKVMAIPYYHFNDDIAQQLYRGQSSICEITIDGDFGSAIIQDSNDAYDPDNSQKSIWDSIVNFTGDFFMNFDKILNDFDNSEMEQDSDTLNQSLQDMEDAEGTVMDDSVNTLEEYDFTTSLTFSAGLVNALSFCKGFVDNFFIASGDYAVIVTVAFAMVFISIVAGIFRFASGRKK